MATTNMMVGSVTRRIFMGSLNHDIPAINHKVAIKITDKGTITPQPDRKVKNKKTTTSRQLRMIKKTISCIIFSTYNF